MNKLNNLYVKLMIAKWFKYGEPRHCSSDCRWKNQSIWSNSYISHNPSNSEGKLCEPDRGARENMYKYDDDDKRQNYMVRKMLLTLKVIEDS